METKPFLSLGEFACFLQNVLSVNSRVTVERDGLERLVRYCFYAQFALCLRLLTSLSDEKHLVLTVY